MISSSFGLPSVEGAPADAEGASRTAFWVSASSVNCCSLRASSSISYIPSTLFSECFRRVTNSSPRTSIRRRIVSKSSYKQTVSHLTFHHYQAHSQTSSSATTGAGASSFGELIAMDGNWSRDCGSSKCWPLRHSDALSVLRTVFLVLRRNYRP